MFKFVNPKKIILFFLLIVSLNYIFFLYRFFNRHNGYILGDWLINYEGGFTRRGLIGEFLTIFSNLTNLNIVFLTYVLVVFVFIFFLYFFYKKLIQTKLNFLLILLIFSPATFLFNFYDPLAIGRKELLFFLYFLIYLDSNDSKRSIILLSIFSSFLTLTHELFFLITPFFFINRYLCVRNSSLNKYYKEIFIFLGSIICFVIIFFFSNPETSKLCQYILSFGLSDSVCLAANDTIKAPLSIAPFITDKYYAYYLLFFFLIILPVILLLKKNNVKFLKIIFLILISFLPMLFLFFIVNDWGRYLNIYAMMWLFILMNVNNFANTNILQKKNVFSMLLIILFSMSWHMPHCCPQIHFQGTNYGYNSGALYVFNRIKFRLNNSN